MLSTFGSLNTALRALQTMQQSIQVSSHNVANAATPGYSRQKTMLATGTPYSVPGSNRYVSLGQVGTGVVIESIHRFRSNFLDSQIRNENTNFKGWETRQDMLQQVQVSFNEPSDTGLNSHLSEFWASWHNLSTTPDSVSTRANVVETAADLSTTIRDTYRQLGDLQTNLDDRVALQVDQINDIATRIADLNATIRDVQGIGQQPNDLRDERDKLLTELAGYINIDAYETDSGSVLVSVGGKQLVMDHIVSKMAVEPDPSNNMLNRVTWADTGATVQILGVSLEGGLSANAPDRLGGELGGTLIARDLILPDKMGQLDDIANALITEVNALHRTGYGLDGSNNRDFFVGTGAGTIAVNDVLKADYNRVATAAAAGTPGDGSIALEIARLEQATVLNGGTTTIGDFYRAVIASLGQEGQQANVMTNNQELLVDHLKTRQEEIAGVSLDEETVNLLQYQRTYQAAARVMTTVDEMLDKVINGMGLVGR